MIEDELVYRKLIINKQNQCYEIWVKSKDNNLKKMVSVKVKSDFSYVKAWTLFCAS